MPFIKAVTQVQVVIEQKPKLQEKISGLIKELVKLGVPPSEDFLVLFGHQWVTMYERKKVDFTRVEEEPQASDNEDDAVDID